MESRTKFAVAEDTVSELVRAGFGPAPTMTACEELTEGTFNTAFAVTLDDRRKLVLKVAPHPDLELLRYETDMLRGEVHFGRRAGAIGLPVAVPVLADFGRTLLPTDYAFFTWLPGTPLNRVPEASAVARRQLGGYVARLGTIGNRWFGYPRRDGRTRASSWRASFLMIIDDILADADRWDARLPVPPARVARLIEENAGVLDEVREPALVHYDLWEGNVLVAPDGSAVTGLIDGERAFYGDPVAEFASMALLRDLADIPDVVAGFAATAGRPARLTAGETRRLALYRAYLHLIMLVEGGSRGFTAEHVRHRFETVGAALEDDLRLLTGSFPGPGSAGGPSASNRGGGKPSKKVHF